MCYTLKKSYDRWNLDDIKLRFFFGGGGEVGLGEPETHNT